VKDEESNTTPLESAGQAVTKVTREEKVNTKERKEVIWVKEKDHSTQKSIFLSA